MIHSSDSDGSPLGPVLYHIFSGMPVAVGEGVAVVVIVESCVAVVVVVETAA